MWVPVNYTRGGGLFICKYGSSSPILLLPSGGVGWFHSISILVLIAVLYLFGINVKKFTKPLLFVNIAALSLIQYLLLATGGVGWSIIGVL